MGCDIHMVVEVRKDGKWQKQVDPFATCPDCNGKKTITYAQDGKTEPCYWCKGVGKQSRYGSRNYNVFSVLGNVRNGSGEFEIPFIGDERGLPADASCAPCTESCTYDEDSGDCLAKHDDLGEHSLSWVSLAELLAYDWDRRMPVEGRVDQKQFQIFREKAKPEEYSGGVMGRLVEHIGNSEMARRIDSPRPPELEDLFNRIAGGVKQYYTLVRWTETLKEMCGDFCDLFIPALQTLGAPEDVRLVFGFDS